MQPNRRKSTRFAPLSQIRSILLTVSISLLLTGCSLLSGASVKEIDTSRNPEPTVPLDIPLPPPVDLDAPNWVVITPKNFSDIMEELKASGREQVLIAVTPSQYRRLSLDLGEIRKYINNQRAILIRYQDYYESSDSSE